MWVCGRGRNMGFEGEVTEVVRGVTDHEMGMGGWNGGENRTWRWVGVRDICGHIYGDEERWWERVV